MSSTHQQKLVSFERNLETRTALYIVLFIYSRSTRVRFYSISTFAWLRCCCRKQSEQSVTVTGSLLMNWTFVSPHQAIPGTDSTSI